MNYVDLEVALNACLKNAAHAKTGGEAVQWAQAALILRQAEKTQ